MGIRPGELVGLEPCSITLWWLIKYQKDRKIKQNSKTPCNLDGCPTRWVGRTPTMFHNTLVVGSSPTSSTTQSRTTGKFPPYVEMLVDRRRPSVFMIWFIHCLIFAGTKPVLRRC